MAIIQIKPFAAAASNASGITLAKGAGKAGEYIRIGLSAEAQERFLGGRLDPARDCLALAVDDDSKHRHLLTVSVAERGDAEAIEISGGIKGSVSVRVAPWMQVAPGKRPAERLPVSHAPKSGLVVVKIPEWARPPIQKPGFGRSIMET